MTKDQFILLFAGWLIGQNEIPATETDQAQHTAENFIHANWQGDPYLPDWIRAWEAANCDSIMDFA